MRTNIDLDDQLVQEALRYSKAKSKRALVEEALRTFIDVQATQQRRMKYREKLAEIRSRTSSLRLKKSPATVVREDRDRA